MESKVSLQKRVDWLKSRISSMEQCRDKMPFGLSEDESMELSTYKNSLASLTANPAAVLDRTGDVLKRKECADDKVFSIFCKVEPALYPAPPVAEIKFRDRKELPDWAMDGNDFFIWYEAK